MRRRPIRIHSRAQATRRCLCRQPFRSSRRKASRPCRSCRSPRRPRRRRRGFRVPSTDPRRHRWSRSRKSRGHTAAPWDSAPRVCNPVRRRWGTMWVRSCPRSLSIPMHVTGESTGRRRARDPRSSTTILESGRCVLRATGCKAVSARPRE